VARAKRLQKKLGLSKEGFAKCADYLEEVATCIPVFLFDSFMKKLWSLVTMERELLDFKYYQGIGCLLNPSLVQLTLDKPRLFQDSSMALESFLDRLDNASKLKEVQMSKSVLELVDFEFRPTLLTVGGKLQKLTKVVLKGLKNVSVSDVTNSTNDVISGDQQQQQSMLEFIKLLENNCGPHLRHLDLSESHIDDLGCDVIARLQNLKVLILNHCNKVSTIGAVTILKRVKNLVQFEANKGRESSVQNAVSALHDEGSEWGEDGGGSGRVRELGEDGHHQLALTHFVFRNPYRPMGVKAVASVCRKIRHVRVVNNVFEHSYDAKIDDCLKDVVAFPSFRTPLSTSGSGCDLTLELDMSCFNMLFAIQMRNLSSYGRALKKVCLTESEFVHPQTLNPFALNCPNLETLVMINPVVVSDGLFVGQVPDLAAKPFNSLKSLTFESEKMSPQIADFLLQHSLQLEHLHLAIHQFEATAKDALTHLVRAPRERLEKLILCFDEMTSSGGGAAAGDDVINGDNDDNGLVHLLTAVIESSPKLAKVELIVRKAGSHKLAKVLRKLEATVHQRNWDLDFNYFVKT